MRKPVLVIMAAGMGSRYGGLKQIDPVDEQGHIIIDFSIYDAAAAGFEEIVFIIKKENEAEFRACIGDRMEHRIKVRYVYQELSLPSGYRVPEGRVKPFGTGHAVLSCRNVVDGPFAVINADDYYGRHAYKSMYDYLSEHRDDDKYRYAMAGYILENTLTEHGHVARGVCTIDGDHNLVSIQERTHIEKRPYGAAYLDEDGAAWHRLPANSTVSMNLWGFQASILKELEASFTAFLDENLAADPLKCEYFLPSVVSNLVEEGRAVVEVLESRDKWYGVTYREDKEMVVNAIRRLKDEGLYPERLWEDA